MSPSLQTIPAISILPLDITVLYSVLKPGTYGGVIWQLSPDAYIQSLFERAFFDDTPTLNPAYLSIFSRSIGLAIGVTLGALISARYVSCRRRHPRRSE